MTTRRTFLQGLGATVPGTALRSQDQAANIVPRDVEREWEHVNRDLTNSTRDPESKIPVENISVTLSTEDGLRRQSHIVLDEDKMVVAEKNESSVRAYDRNTGNTMWAFDEGTVRRAPAIGDDFFYFTALDGTVYAVDENGNKAAENKVDSAAETAFVDNYVLTAISLAEITLFDKNLQESATFERPGDVALASESLTVDEQGRAIYVEFRQGGSPNTSLRMLDLSNPSETDTLNEIDAVNVGSDAENGAVLHNGVFYWNEGGVLKGREILDSGFGAEVVSMEVGDWDVSPVSVGDHLWFGADGDIFKYSTAEGELEVIDSVEGWVENMVGGANTVVVGYENSEVINTRAYDTRTGNLVAEFTDGFKMPKAVVDGKIVMKEATGGTSAYFEIWDGEYRDIGPEVSALSTEYSGIVGEELSLSVVVDTPWDAISWEITDSTGAVVAQEADVESWSLTPEFDPGATYEVVVEVVYRGESETRSAQLSPSPPPVVGTTPPRDIDDDGLYEDVTGTGDASVLDTQALFTAVDTGEIQHPELYNFSSASPDTDVTILDVAAHWRFHGAQ